jgi:hypothetical protein
MPYTVALPDGRTVQFPDDVPQEKAAEILRQQFPAPAPSTERTWGEAIKDVPASLLTGAGSLLQAPGQLAKLVPGLKGVGEALEVPGEAVKQFGTDLKSAGLKAREALRSQAISDAEKDGILSEFATAITSTLKDPALITSFITEQVPLLLGPLGAARLTTKLGMGAVEGATAGAAREAAAAKLGQKATTAAIGTGTAMQAADVSGNTYDTALKRALEMGMPQQEAEDAALNAARIAAGGAAAVSFGANVGLGKLGGTAIERRLAGLPGQGRIQSGVGEATSETLEEAGGQVFQNVGVRTVDPSQSLTQGVGSAAAMGALGGGFFGSMLGKRPEADLAPGQLPGESLYDTAARINRDIKTVDDLAKAAETDQARTQSGLMTNTQLVDMYREQGYGAVKQYQQQLLDQAADPSLPREQKTAAREAAQQIQELFKQVDQEEVSRRAKAEVSNIITDKDVTINLGIPRKDPLYQQLVNKNIGRPEDAEAVIQALESALSRKGLRQTQYERFNTALAAVNEYLATIPGSGFYARPSVQQPSGASPVVASVPSADTAPAGGGTPQPSGVVPAEPDAAQPVGRKAEPTTPVMEDDITPQKPAEEFEQNRRWEENKAKVIEVVKNNFNSALDQVGEYGSIDEAFDAYETNALDTLQEEGFGKDPEWNNLSRLAHETYGRMVAEHKAKQAAPTPPAVAAPAPFVTTSVSYLPKDLALAKPRYAYGAKQFQLQFNSDIDKALYITAQKAPSKRDADYRAWLEKQGFTPDEVAQGGQRVRSAIKNVAAKAEPADGPINLPEQVKKPTVKRSLAPELEKQLEPIYQDLERRAKAPKKDQPKAAPAKAAPKEDTQRDLLMQRRAELVKQLDGILKKILAKYNLTGVTLNLEEGMAEEGSYSGQIIKLALNLENPVRVLRHESIHALKDMGFFSDAQWKTLVKKAQDEWVQKYLKDREHSATQSRYDAYVDLLTKEGNTPAQVEEAIIEEAIADAFGDFDVNGAPPGLMAAIHRRMKALFKAIKEAFGQAGIDTAEEIFGKIEKGSLKPAIPMGKEQAPKMSLRGIPLSTRTLMEQEDNEARAAIGLNTKAKRGRYNNVRDIARALNDDTLNNFSAMNRKELTEDDVVKIADAMADEVAYQLGTTSETGTGLGWYSSNYPKAVKRLQKRFPELGDNQHARSVFSAIVAVTSNGEKVTKNISNAVELYAKIRQGKPLVAMGNRRATALVNNLRSIERLLEIHGTNFEKYLLEEITVKDMNARLREMGEKSDGSYLADTVVPRAAIYFGPKLGAFYANLSGSEGYLTMDLWWTRSINRMRGLLIPKATDASIDKFREMMGQPEADRDEVVAAAIQPRNKYKEYGFTTELEYLAGGKEPTTKLNKPAWFKRAEEAAGDAYEQLLFDHNLEKMANTIYKNEYEMLEEAPFTATDRAFMYKAARNAQKTLQDSGIDLTLADIQAALWYYEKRLYGKLSGVKANDIGYEEAIIAQASEGDGRVRPSVVFGRGSDGGADTGREVQRTDEAEREPADNEQVEKKSLRSESPQFKFWFGQSKIVDKDGKPKVMYHGTARDITEFKPKQAGAIFLTDDPKFADNFANLSMDYIVRERFDELSDKEKDKVIKSALRLARQNGVITPADAKFAYQTAMTGGNLNRYGINPYLKKFMEPHLKTGENILPLYVKAEYPFDYENDDHVNQVVRLMNMNFDSSGRKLGDKEEGGIRAGDWERIEKESVQKAIQTIGFDAFYVKEAGRKNLAVYNPEQIKSATGNVGTFDLTNPDIRYSLRSAPTTPEFKRWFGDSKVVDADGKPLVVYHGSPVADITEFRGGKTAYGIFFSDSEYSAAYYNPQANQRKVKAGDVYEVYLKANKVADLRKSSVLKRILDEAGRSDEFDAIEEAISRGDMYAYDSKGRVQDEIVQTAESMGFDAVILPDATSGEIANSYIVFKPTQIKSATGNVGTYDPNNPDIRYSLRSPIGLYSELENKVEAVSSKAAPAGQWKAMINAMTQKGVKPEEIEWSGVNDWLDLQGGKVNKDDLLDYLKNNGVQVEETVLGERDRAEAKILAAQDIAESIQAGLGEFNDDAQSMLDRWRSSAEGSRIESQSAAALEEMLSEAGDNRSIEDFIDAGGAQTDTTKYGQYTLPGGENYREVLLTLPVTIDKSAGTYSKTSSGFWRVIFKNGDTSVFRTEADAKDALSSAPSYSSSHWDQPNVLAHIRVNDRTDADGNKVLFVEEIQSDWGQEGKKRGFGSGPTKFEVSNQDGIVLDIFDNRQDADALAAEGRYRFVRDLTALGVPVAPFVTTRKFAVYKDGKEVTRKDKDGKDVKQRYENMEVAEAAAKKVGGEARDLGMQANTEGWLNLALKRIMIMAAEGGYDKVAFVNGDQSADRFDLSRSIDRIDAKRRPNGTYEIDVSTKDGKDFNRSGLTPEELEDNVGKEMAQKIIDATASDQKRMRFSGLDLKVGGEGMRAFYDKIVPTTLKKLLPKVGGSQVEMVTIPDPQGTGRTMEVKNFLGEKETIKIADEPALEQAGFNVTPAMREKIETTGLPKFSLRSKPFDAKKLPKNDKDYVLPEGTILYHGAYKSVAEAIKSANYLMSRPAIKAHGGSLDEGGLVWFGGKETAQNYADSKADPMAVQYDRDAGIIREPGQVFEAITDKPYKLISRYKVLSKAEADALNKALGLPDYKSLSKGSSVNLAASRADNFRNSNIERYKIGIRDRQEEMSAPWPVIFKTLNADGFYDGNTVALTAENGIRLSEDGKPMERFSLRSTLPASAINAMDKIAPPRYEPGYAERIMSAVTGDAFTSIRQKLVNRYEALAVLDRRVAKTLKQMGGATQLASSRAETAALMSDLGAGVLESAMGVHDRVGGAPIFRNGVTTVSNYGGTVKGLLEIFKPIAAMKDADAFRLYQTWAAVKRGKRLTVEGREDLIDAADIRAIDSLTRTNKDMIKMFEQVQKEWTAYNNALVKYQVDTGVISPAMAKEWTKHGDYFPFYRLMEGEDIAGPKVFSSIGNVSIGKKLKGGEDPLGDFFENIVRNSQAAIQAGMKNVAAQAATNQALIINEVTRLNRKPQSHESVYRVYENGKEVYYRANDPLFIEAIKALNMADLPFMGLLSKPAAMLRNLVTKDPAFMLANMMRDSLSAWATTGIKMTPIIDTLNNFGKAIAGKSPELDALYAAGVLGGYDYARGTRESADVFATTLRRRSGQMTPFEIGTKPFTSLWEALEKGTQASDAATRMEVYKKTLAATGNELEALSAALEVMNFNRKGNSAIVRVLTAAVPFLNARIQGLDILFRTAIMPLGGTTSDESVQRMKTFWVRGMTIMALSSMYWLLTHDDEEYKKQEQETRDNNWLLPSLGVKIPIPFEVGVLFKVIPERLMQLSFGTDTAKDFTDAMKRQFLSTFAFNLVPQVALPLYEVKTNYSFFTDRPIIGKGLENVVEKYQVGPSTSRFSQLIGEYAGFSPMKTDYLIKGYFGTIGSYASDLFDMMYDMGADSPKASKRFSQLPIIKRFAVDPDARGTVTAFYKFQDQVDQAVRTANLLERSNNFEEGTSYTVENLRLLASDSYVKDVEKSLKDYREMKQQIMSMPLSAETKRDLLLNASRMESLTTANIQSIKKFAQ